MEELLKEIQDISVKYNIVLTYLPIGAMYIFNKPEDIIKKEIISFTPEIMEFYNNNRDYNFITKMVIREEIPIFYNIKDCLTFGLNHLKNYLKHENNQSWCRIYSSK